MRIDKFFSETGILTRKESAEAVKRHRIFVDGVLVAKHDFKFDEHKSIVTLDGTYVKYKPFVYIMLNKPEGYVSATEDTEMKTVIDLLPAHLQRLNLFPCGRLDKATLGLVILTNDGQAAHALLSPKHHVSKIYYYECAEPLSESDRETLEAGVLLADGYYTKPCKIEKTDDYKGYITLTEGKYHQIKRMFGERGNSITFLERLSFSTIKLDNNLNRGEWRYLTDEEEKVFITAVKR